MYRYIKSKLKKMYTFKVYKAMKITILIAAVILMISITVYMQDTAMPMLIKATRYKVNSLAVTAVNNAVNKAMAETDMLYEDLMKMRFDGEGKIIAIETDAVKINTVKSAVTKYVELEFSKTSAKKIKIPIGSFTGIGFLSGWGPNVAVKVVPLGVVSIDYDNVFTEAGINQTRHQIFIDIAVDMQICLPTAQSEYERVKTSVCLAETVIVGGVPDVYMGK